MTASIGPDLRVAIMSACGRFPGAESAERLWLASLAGQVLLHRFERKEMLEDGVFRAELDAPNYVPVKGWLENTDCFDAHAFGFSAAEAASIDPQQRIFLEECARALDFAAVDPSRFPGRIGVFAGQFISTYFIRNLAPRLATNTDGVTLATSFQGNTVDQLATRVAYRLNLRGPAVTVQTACSTSLVAVHMACSSLLNGECDLALAGGVAISFPSRSGYMHFEGGIHSRTGRCRPFDQHADGTIFGDGVGVIVLRRLSEAIAARDTIRAVILATAVNNDGARKVGYSAPSVDGQKNVLSEALALADLRPQDVGYVESHGTGTPIGDAVEMAALKAVYTRDTERPPLAIGALKANCGHLEAAAGIAGLIRTISVLENGVVPPIADLQTVNPILETDGLPIVFPKQPMPWSGSGTPRRAAVSAFGVGGTNASMIVEQAPIRDRRRGASNAPRLVPISAASKSSAAASCRAIATAAAEEIAELADTQSTLALGRPQLAWRCAVVADTNAELARVLPHAAIIEGATEPKAILIFPGQGSLVPGLARGLYDANGAFRERFDEIEKHLKHRGGPKVREVVLGTGGEPMTNAAISHAATFALSYSLAEWLDLLGVPVAAAIGHSVGEFVAATRAGVFSLDHALTLVLARGELIASLPAGGMLAVSLDADRVAAMLTSDLADLDIACFNGPELTTVAGTRDDLHKLRSRLSARRIASVELAVDCAFHSRMMKPIEQAWRNVLGTINFHAPQTAFYSTVVGGRIDATTLSTPDYWISHLLGPVRFKDALLDAKKAIGGDRVILIQTGAASGFVREAAGWLAAEQDVRAVALLAAATKSRSDAAALESVGKLWCLGIPVDWSALLDSSARRVALPARQFERTRHFIEAPGATATTPQLNGSVPSAGPELMRTVYRTIAADSTQHISQHQRRWLIVAESPEATSALAEYLLDHGQIVTVVSPGSAQKRVRRGFYQLPLHDPGCWLDFLRDLRSLVRTPTIVIHASALNRDVSVPALLQSLIALADAWVREATGDLRIGVIAPAVHPILGNEELDPRAAALHAMTQVLEQEVPSITTCCIDLCVRYPTHEVAIDSATAALISEALCSDAFESHAIRGSRLFARQFEKFQGPVLRQSPYRRGGVYLVTGGSGALGGLIAADLARRFSATVIVTSRRVPLTGEAGHLRDDVEGGGPFEGGRIVHATCDVTDVAALRRLMSRIQAEFGELNGVFHAAGVADGEFLTTCSAEHREAVFAPKARGLEAVLSSLGSFGPSAKLDFIVAFSSTATIVGGPGQGTYAAANAEMDALTQNARRTSATRIVTVRWDTIRDTGMARGHTATGSSPLADTRDAYAIEPERCPQLLEEALGSGMNEIVITRVDAAELANAHRRIKQYFGSATKRAARPDLAVAYSAPSSELEKRLAQVWGYVLGIEQVGLNDPFTDLGGHSLIAARLKGEVKKVFDVDLPVSAVFAADTVSAMAAVIETAILAELEPPEPAAIGAE